MRRIGSATFAGLAVGLTVLAGSAAAGNLDPPGAPAPTMKTLAEIEPRTAVQTLAGSGTGLFVITQPGSYYLTGNIVTAETAKNAIEISAHGVTLDLMGFALIGPGRGTGTGSGVLVRPDVSAPRREVSILNGIAHSWGAEGIDAQRVLNGRFQDLQISSNGSHGLVAGDNTDGFHNTITRCLARFNGLAGISAGRGSVISGCTAQTNGTGGISTGPSSNITACTATGNQFGISAGAGTSISHCSSRDNASTGIAAGSVCIVSRCSATGNDGDGITAGGDSDISDSTASENGGDGIVATFRTSIRGCTASSNTGAAGPTKGRGVVVGDASSVTGCTVSGNALHGISISDMTTVTGNNCSDNGDGPGDGAGVFVAGNDNRVESNHVTRNDYGIRADATSGGPAGNFIASNRASGNAAADYSANLVGGGNSGGAILDATAGGTVSASSVLSNIAY